MIKKALVKKFGCQMQFADAEKIEGILRSLGIEITENIDEADIVFLCTCAVRETAENKIYSLIGNLGKIKKDRPDFKIALCGCMANEKETSQKIKKSYPQVDLIFGTGSISKIPQMLEKISKNKKYFDDFANYLESFSETAPVRESNYRALVPISSGCNNFCTYCIVPYTRGREKSREFDSIVNEVEDLVKSGYKEIFLLGQNVNSYGKDLPGKPTFADLLKRLEEIPGDFWIRFLSSHPKDASKELMDIVRRGTGKTEPHFHLPLQSGSDEVLCRMNRHYDTKKYLELVKFLRQDDPMFSITTDIIVGFPGETQEQFEDTLKLMKICEFDNIFSFIYSKRSGTKAADFDDPVSKKEKSDRMQKLLSLQREISSKRYEKYVGSTFKVLVDSRAKKDTDLMTGKNHAGIIVEFAGDESLIGKFVYVKITESRNWALKGEKI